MNEPKTLTASVLRESYKVRRWESVDGRRRLASQGNYLRGILASYEGPMGDDYAQIIIAGKQAAPKALVAHYGDGVHICPQLLAQDIASYYQSDAISYRQHMMLRDDLLRILQTIPTVDQEEIMSEVEACSTEVYKTYTLMAGLLYYAWRTALSDYTYKERAIARTFLRRGG